MYSKAWLLFFRGARLCYAVNENTYHCFRAINAIRNVSIPPRKIRPNGMEMKTRIEFSFHFITAINPATEARIDVRYMTRIEIPSTMPPNISGVPSLICCSDESTATAIAVNMKARNKPEDHFPSRVRGNSDNFMATPHASYLYRRHFPCLFIHHRLKQFNSEIECSHMSDFTIGADHIVSVESRGNRISVKT